MWSKVKQFKATPYHLEALYLCNYPALEENTFQIRHAEYFHDSVEINEQFSWSYVW